MVNERELERVLKAAANRKRIAILRLLKSGSATVGEIAKSIKLSLKSTSRHLQVLSNAGYVTAERQSLYIHYALAPQSELVARVLKLVLA
jgi:DNA-binding transcriptional ArsR family regulator